MLRARQAARFFRASGLASLRSGKPPVWIVLCRSFGKLPTLMLSAALAAFHLVNQIYLANEKESTMYFSQRQKLSAGGLTCLAAALVVAGTSVSAQRARALPQARKVRVGAAAEPQQTTVPLTSGTAQTGTVSGTAGRCVFGGTQYSIQVGADAKRLLVNLTGDQDVDVYVRYNAAIPVQNNRPAAADYFSIAEDTQEEVAVTANVLPALQAGTYYIGVDNCGGASASISVTATVSNGGGQVTEELRTDDGFPDDGFVGNGLYYINRLTPLQYPSQLQKIRIQLVPIQGFPDPTGAQIRLLAFNLPSGSALPATLPTTLLLDRNVTLPTISGFKFYDFDVPELPMIKDGDWYIGYQAPNPAAGVSVIVDQFSTPQNRFLFANSSGGPFQLDDSENAMIRAVVVSGSGTAPNAVASVSAASFSADALAANSIVAAFGTKLATTFATGTPPYPTTLAGTTVKLRDSGSFERLASLFFVSPGQINYLIPAGTANGAATVTVTAGDGTISTGTINVVSIAPGLLGANANGQGVAAGVVVRVKADGSQVLEQLVTFDNAQAKFVAVPVDVSNAAEQVVVVLFGTGFSNIGPVANAAVRLGSTTAEVLFAGPQGGLAGLDQLNVRVPRTLAGSGDIPITFTAGGRTANTVRLTVK